jgi:ASC-1-like (ASCH) protein
LYQTFKEALQKEGLKKCLPNSQTLEEGIKIYHSFAGYLENESKLMVVALRLRLLKNFENYG